MTPYDTIGPVPSAPLVDGFGRTVSYLRVSVTDRCDLRCVYCMAEHMTFLPKAEVLTLEELDRIVSAFVATGTRKLRLFGRLGDLAGWRERSFEPPPGSLSSLKAVIANLDAALGAVLNGPGVQAAVNRAIVRGDVVLAAGAEVAFLPPMSGG